MLQCSYTTPNQEKVVKFCIMQSRICDLFILFNLLLADKSTKKRFNLLLADKSTKKRFSKVFTDQHDCVL